jgi:hypothetical protein
MNLARLHGVVCFEWQDTRRHLFSKINYIKNQWHRFIVACLQQFAASFWAFVHTMAL